MTCQRRCTFYLVAYERVSRCFSFNQIMICEMKIKIDYCCGCRGHFSLCVCVCVCVHAVFCLFLPIWFRSAAQFSQNCRNSFGEFKYFLERAWIDYYGCLRVMETQTNVRSTRDRFQGRQQYNDQSKSSNISHFQMACMLLQMLPWRGKVM